jgi:hypothetical protein
MPGWSRLDKLMRYQEPGQRNEDDRCEIFQVIFEGALFQI